MTLSVIFDLDGTLVHVHGDWNKVHEMIKPFKRVEEAANDAINEDDVAFFERLHQLEMNQPPTALFGVKLSKTLTCNQYIVTNSTHKTAEECVSLFGLSIQGIIGIDDVNMGKPNPEGILKIISTYNLKKENCLYIGNAKTDMEAAEAAGIAHVKIQEICFNDD